jgi:catechol 2,3-dioxygenase-like lactoylglutathione lyase family enzyme
VPRVLNHVGIAVSDLEASVEFYRLLGFEEAGPQNWRLSEPWLTPLLGLDDTVDMSVSYLALAGSTLELLQFHAPSGQPADAPALNDVGITHIALEVDDVPAEHRRLVEAGVKFLGDPVTIPDGDLAGLSFAFALDPDGNRVEFTTSSSE